MGRVWGLNRPLIPPLSRRGPGQGHLRILVDVERCHTGASQLGSFHLIATGPEEVLQDEVQEAKRQDDEEGPAAGRVDIPGHFQRLRSVCNSTTLANTGRDFRGQLQEPLRDLACNGRAIISGALE